MKSGVQLNFFERRALADRALSRLVEIAREQTETMSSREQRGVYQLETTLADGTSALAPAVRGFIDPVWIERWKVFFLAVVALVRKTGREMWSGARALKLPRRSRTPYPYE